MNHFEDLNDTLDDLMNSPLRTAAPARTLPAGVPADGFTSKCPSCRGSGKFISYTGRVVGACFKCKGAGTQTFKTSPADRAKSRQGAAHRKVRTIETRVTDFAADFPAVAAWIVANPSFAFAVAMGEAVQKFGSLTAGQMAAVQKCIDRDATRKVEAAARDVAAPVVEMEKLELAFNSARKAASDDGEGLQWLVLRLDTFKFSDAPANGQYAAAIFVKEGDTKLGRIVGGKFKRSFACDDATESRIVAAAADPFTAAKAYGQRTKSCSCCGRTLTNKVSRELGIGPICAEKYGW